MKLHAVRTWFDFLDMFCWIVTDGVVKKEDVYGNMELDEALDEDQKHVKELSDGSVQSRE
ncbi:hypothetical protein ACJQWK_11667 [Exserohilum turcicum]